MGPFLRQILGLRKPYFLSRLALFVFCSTNYHPSLSFLTFIVLILSASFDELISDAYFSSPYHYASSPASNSSSSINQTRDMSQSAYVPASNSSDLRCFHKYSGFCWPYDTKWFIYNHGYLYQGINFSTVSVSLMSLRAYLASFETPRSSTCP